jgi:hypothetical protein
MRTYRQKSYGRNEEVAELFRLFDSGKNVSMHGPRRLGKTFVVERMVEQGREYRYTCAKVELAGCTDTDAALRMLCEGIEKHRSWFTNQVDTLASRARNFWRPVKAGTLEESAVRFDWEAHVTQLLVQTHSDAHTCWAMLIDELPIFLKALHDTGEQGVLAARNFMNLLTRLMSTHPHVRWLVTGSIGITPLARAGQYLGVLAKFHEYTLNPLTHEQALNYVVDLPRLGLHPHRAEITPEEAEAVVNAVGWRSAYYLEAFALYLPAVPQRDAHGVENNIKHAQRLLLADTTCSRFSTWEEHITKHHGPDRDLSFACLAAICRTDRGLSLDGLLGILGQPDLSRSRCLQLLTQLCDEGFLYQEDPADEACPYCFRIPLLRLWWQRYQPGI